MALEDQQTLAAFMERLQQLEDRFSFQEEKIDKIIQLIEKASGAWVFAKWVAAVLIGVSALWQFGMEHIRIK